MMASIVEDDGLAAAAAPTLEIDIPTSDPANLQLCWPECVNFAEEMEGLDMAESVVLHAPSPPRDGNETTVDPAVEPSLLDAHPDNETIISLPSFEDTRQIRLLQVLKGDDMDPIHGTINVTSLTNDAQASSYEALSYTWADEHGHNDKSRRIFIGKFWDVLHVTNNCERALRRLRLADADRTVWVDAICIDQGDRKERSHQVGMMRDIYSCARQVIVYLGEEKENSGTAILTMHRKQFDEGREIGHSERFALEHLFRRPYFERLWIVQEFLLANMIQIICGPHSATFIPKHNPVWRFAIQEGHAPPWLDGRSHEFDQPVVYLQQLIERTRWTSCLDPRDKLFGLLGLISWGTKPQLAADYSVSLEQLHIGLAAFIMQNDTTLGFDNILRGVHHQENRLLPNLPFWVPDLACEGHVFDPVNLRPNGVSDREIFLKRMEFDPQLRYQISKSLGSLQVHGIELCQLQQGGSIVQTAGQQLMVIELLSTQLKGVVHTRNLDLRGHFPEKNDSLFWLRGSETFVVLRKLGDSSGRYQLIVSCRIFPDVYSNDSGTTLLYPVFTDREKATFEAIQSRLKVAERLERNIYEYRPSVYRDHWIPVSLKWIGRNKFIGDLENPTVYQLLETLRCICVASYYSWAIPRTVEPSVDNYLTVNGLLANLWAVTRRHLACDSTRHSSYISFIQKIATHLFYFEMLQGQSILEEKRLFLM